MIKLSSIILDSFASYFYIVFIFMNFWGGQKQQCIKIVAHSMEIQSRSTSSLEVVLTGVNSDTVYFEAGPP